MTPITVPFEDGGPAQLREDYIAQLRRSASLPDLAAEAAALLRALLGADDLCLTHTASAALEMACLLIGLQPGDEVIMPSFTHPATANAVVLRGAVPVFVDVLPTTLAIDPAAAAAAVSPGTKAIIAVHYAGMAADLPALTDLAARHGLYLIEDAAHCIDARFQGGHLGTFGHLGVLSFHATKNVSCGEGGALIVNDPGLRERACIVADMGTNRRDFLNGKTDRYEWLNAGSSFRMNDWTAALLASQLPRVAAITQARRRLWDRYLQALLGPAGALGVLPHCPADCRHNGHIFHLLLRSSAERARLTQALRDAGIDARFHFQPLHRSPAGRAYGLAPLPLPISERAGDALLRLPLHAGLGEDEQQRVIACVTGVLETMEPS